MVVHSISSQLKQFLFEYVDSVELLEVLFYLRSHPNRWFDSGQISAELRSNPTSISTRISRLISIGLLEQNETKDFYTYRPQSSELAALIDELVQEYQLRRHAIFELIFSNSKNARHFANAFIVNKPKNPNGDSDG